MEVSDLTKDDLEDVMDLTHALMKSIEEQFDDQPKSVCLSAIVNASVMESINKCDSIEEVYIIKDLFLRIFDHTISLIKKG